MSLLSLHPRDPDVRAARLAGGVALALALAIGVAAWALFRDRPGRRGPGMGRSAPAVADIRGTAGAGAATVAAGAAANEAAREKAGGDAGDDRRGDAPDAEDLLVALDHLERQIDAATARCASRS